MAKLRNSSELNCGPLSDTKVSGTPYRANITNHQGLSDAKGGRVANLLHLNVVAIIVTHLK